MIELTEAQTHSLDAPGSGPPRAVNTRTNQQFVLLPLEEYERLKLADYDDSPWTREELEAAAWEVGVRRDGNAGDEYDDLPEKS